MDIILVPCTFLGQHVGGGVTQHTKDALQRVEAALQRKTFPEIYGIGGWRADAGHHTGGIAIDLNYATNGYAVTRTKTAKGWVFGGEWAGRRISGARKAFMAACDHACLLAGVPCDLSARKKGESTGEVWERWRTVSEAVKKYLALYFPAEDKLDVGENDVIPGTTIPPQYMADYWALRVPLVVGAPVANPRTTRNPARGLMDLPKDVVVALCDVGGFRWGACDFGAESSGDIMHFDLAERIESGA
jgi:hypothetical protein